MKRLVLLLIALAATAIAQDTPSLETGLKPYGSYAGGDLDSISLSGGNLTLHIPIISYPQRGGKLDVQYFLVLNAKSWVAQRTVTNAQLNQGYWKWKQRIATYGAGHTSNDNAPGGFANVVMTNNHDIGLKSYINSVPFPDGAFNQTYAVGTADGARHPLEAIYLSGGPTPDRQYRALDGSGFLATLTNPATVISPSGVRYIAVNNTNNLLLSKIEDSNGNYMTVNGSTLTDTWGRSLPWAGVTTPDLSGCQAADTAAVIWNFPGYNGGIYPVKICSRTVSVKTNFGITTFGSDPVYESDVYSNILNTTVVLPDGSSWKFEYNDVVGSANFGNLTNITFPTGGSISYSWTNKDGCNSDLATSRAIASRTVNANDGLAPATWTYDVGLTATETTPGTMDASTNATVANQIIHTFSSFGNCARYETKTQYYQAAGGQLLKTVDTTYGLAASYNRRYDTTYAINVFPTRVAAMLDGQQTVTLNTYDSNTTTIYDKNFYDNQGSLSTAPLVLGSIGQEEVYDYAINPNNDPAVLGSLLRRTVNTYVWQSSTAYKDNNLIQLADSSEVLGPTCPGSVNGSVVRCSFTSIGYDQYNANATPSGQSLALVGSGISTQRDTPPVSSVRGNPTTKNLWLASGMLQEATGFYDTGMPAWSEDPKGNRTQYEYDASTAGALRTKTTNPLSHIVSATYDWNTGLITSFTDATRTGTTSYTYDFMHRPDLITFPTGGGQVDFDYPSLTEAVKKVLHAPGFWITSHAYFDGLGRTVRTQLDDASSGDIKTETTYDARGRVWKVKNPYRTGEATYTTQTWYDALGRTSKVIPTDGSATANNMQTTYSANTTIVTDQAGKQRKTYTDALGRITRVDEPGAQQ
jgi:hypothetical protein